MAGASVGGLRSRVDAPQQVNWRISRPVVRCASGARPVEREGLATEARREFNFYRVVQGYILTTAASQNVISCGIAHPSSRHEARGATSELQRPAARIPAGSETTPRQPSFVPLHAGRSVHAKSFCKGTSRPPMTHCCAKTPIISMVEHEFRAIISIRMSFGDPTSVAETTL